jgi:hypothetical protein
MTEAVLYKPNDQEAGFKYLITYHEGVAEVDEQGEIYDEFESWDFALSELAHSGWILMSGN